MLFAYRKRHFRFFDYRTFPNTSRYLQTYREWIYFVTLAISLFLRVYFIRQSKGLKSRSRYWRMSWEEREDVQNANHVGQFHQHFASSFCTNILLPKNYKAKLIREKLRKKLSCKNSRVKSWWNWHMMFFYENTVHNCNLKRLS